MLVSVNKRPQEGVEGQGTESVHLASRLESLGSVVGTERRMNRHSLSVLTACLCLTTRLSDVLLLHAPSHTLF